MRGTQNLDWSTIGCVSLVKSAATADLENPVSQVFFPPPNRGGNYQVRVRISELYSSPRANEANMIFVHSWGNHTIQSVEFVIPANYVPPAQFVIYDAAGAGLSHGITLKGGTVTPGTGITVPFDRSRDNLFEFELEFASPLDISKFERIVISWEGVHPELRQMGVGITFFDADARGRWRWCQTQGPAWMPGHNSIYILGENVQNPRGSINWRTLNKNRIVNIKFESFFAHVRNFEEFVSPNDPALRDLVIKNIRFIAPEN
ncbi:MAG: hypothetical protein LBU88_08710 [Treponema sp.]|jgi:hypothetical protein|nr:hypothetical protein [Treponema sp.]